MMKKPTLLGILALRKSSLPGLTSFGKQLHSSAEVDEASLPFKKIPYFCKKKYKK
jgi:hypothetical protein